MDKLNPTLNDKAGYQNRRLTFDENTLRDDNGRAIMMDWEKPLMEAQAKTVCQNGGKILNVGFGMGYIDDAIQTYDIEHHTIIECHPDVWQKMREDGWMNKPNVECIFGTWQEIMPKLEREGRMFNGVYFDTWDENDIAFHLNIERLILPGGIYSWFNKTNDPEKVQMDGRYIPLLNWFDIECEKLECVPPTEEEQNDGKGEGWYWNPESTIYWNPIAVRKLWT
tara:strand:+ start:171 stop:842 length:672 start_codon:yes stop_codon:yes gene_type:complete